jgi:hypothetical protein
MGAIKFRLYSITNNQSTSNQSTIPSPHKIPNRQFVAFEAETADESFAFGS